MKTNKLFRVNFTKAEVIYSVFETCNVFTLLDEKSDNLIPIYDFSGNSVRSSLNSLRRYYPGSVVKFYSESSFCSQTFLPRPYHLLYSDCVVFF